MDIETVEKILMPNFKVTSAHCRDFLGVLVRCGDQAFITFLKALEIHQPYMLSHLGCGELLSSSSERGVHVDQTTQTDV